MSLILGVLEQGLIYAILALGVYITYKILDFPDLSVDSTFPLGAAVTAVMISAGVHPLLTLPVLRLITADPVLLGAMVIIAGCPSGIVVTVLAIQYGRDAEYTSKGILLDTVLSMVTLPALVYFLL